jgi:hypothetical protein
MSDVQPLGAKRHVRSTGGHARRKKVDKVENARDWTIKSLPPETVEISREAAKRSGMKINAWVGRALQSAAIGDPSETLTLGDGAVQIVDLEHSILREIAALRLQNENLTQTVNSISSMLLKMYTK